MFVNRNTEFEILNERYFKTSSKSELFIIYGRRRVGKTELIRHFIQNKPHIYYMADQRSEKEQIETFSMLLSDFFKDPLLIEQPLKDWDIAFKYIENHTKKGEKFLLIFDEYPYLAEINPAISSILQKHWDEKLKFNNIFIILCGSSMSFMEKEILSYKSPLYGRRTGQLEIKPFSIFESHEMFPHISANKVIEVYSIYGGIPAYLENFDPQKNLWDNIHNNILKQDSLLYNEVNYLLMQELRTPKNYFSILRSISLGNNKLNDISQRAGLDRQSVIKYLDNLIELKIVTRSVPITENPLKSRKGLYFIFDNYFKFWFRFVYPYLTYVEEGRTSYIIDKIKKELNVLQGKVFEDICKDYLKKNLEIIPFDVEAIGSWWDKNKEIDILVTGQDYKLLFCECKYSNKLVGTNILNDLLQKSQDFVAGKKQYILFSKSGLTKDLVQLEKKSGLKLISLNDMGI